MRARSVNARIFAGFAVAIAVALLVGVAGIWRMHQISTNLEAISEHSLQPINEVADIRSSVDQIEMNIRAHAATDVFFEKQNFVSDTQGALDQAATHVESFRATQPSATELEQVAALESDLTALTPIVFDELMPLSDANKLEAFQATFKEKAAPLFADAQEAADSLMAAENAAAAQELSHAQSAYTQAVVGLVAILLLGIAVATLLGLMISRSIVVPLRDSVETLERVAEGDLTASVQVVGTDEMAMMGTALNATVGPDGRGARIDRRGRLDPRELLANPCHDERGDGRRRRADVRRRGQRLGRRDAGLRQRRVTRCSAPRDSAPRSRRSHRARPRRPMSPPRP